MSAVSPASVNRRCSVRPPWAGWGGGGRDGGSGLAGDRRVARVRREQAARLFVPAGQRALQHRRDHVGGEHADRAARPQDPGDGRHRGGRRIDVLEHVVADHEVRRAVTDQPGDLARLALDGGQGDAELGRPPARGGEGVRARVHHRDMVPELGQPHREPAGPRADVDDLERGPADLGRANRQDLVERVGDLRRRRPAATLGVVAVGDPHGCLRRPEILAAHRASLREISAPRHRRLPTSIGAGAAISGRRGPGQGQRREPQCRGTWSPRETTVVRRGGPPPGKARPTFDTQCIH